MAVSSDRDPKELRQLIEEQILYRLERVPGSPRPRSAEA
jgi:hypothetical protein